MDEKVQLDEVFNFLLRALKSGTPYEAIDAELRSANRLYKGLTFKYNEVEECLKKFK